MIEEILKERGERYGDFKDHAKICQDLKKVMNSTMGWEFLSPSQAQALEVIADKIARMLNGDPNYDDNWVDIIGYSQLVLNEIQEHEGQTKMEFEGLNIGDLSAEGGLVYAGSGNWLYTNSTEGMELLKFKERMEDGIKITDPISGREYEAGIDISSHEAGDH